MWLRVFPNCTDARAFPSRSLPLDTKARGTKTPDGFVDHAGLLARAAVVSSLLASGVQLRQALMESGRLVPEGAQVHLTEDHVFSSPLTAVMVMLGRTSNGRIEWKAVDSRNLRDLQADARA